MDTPVMMNSNPAFHENGPVECRLLIWPTVFAVRDVEVENPRVGEDHENWFRRGVVLRGSRCTVEGEEDKELNRGEFTAVFAGVRAWLDWHRWKKRVCEEDAVLPIRRQEMRDTLLIVRAAVVGIEQDIFVLEITPRDSFLCLDRD
jgi:hypothetical protein